MEREVRRSDQRTSRKAKKYRRRRIVQSLACLVVFCTTYALILPAITLEKPAYCGFKEHKHSDKCYTQKLVCEKEEGEGHTHSDACYTEHQNLICGLEESEGHTHTEECYQTYDNLICELEENEEHTHGPECYEQVTELVCTLEETEGHTHTEACYETVRELSCGLEESKGHTHTEKCYKKILTCKLEEHEHTLACYSNPKADVETQAQWEATLPKEEELTGIWADDLLKVAESQLNYVESEHNYQVVDDDVTMGYTRYGAWYGMPYEDWCAMFIEFCLHYAGIPKADMPRAASCTKWVRLLTEKEMYMKAEDGRPEPGDLVFFDVDKYEGPDHVGIVIEVDEKDGIKTIEGNSGNKVAHREYKWDDKTLYGYGLLPENPDPEVKRQLEEHEPETLDPEEMAELHPEAEETEVSIEESSAEEQKTVEFTGETDTVTVRVEAPEGAFPEGTTMEVSTVAPEDVMDAVTGAVDGEVAHVDAVDIKFVYEGEEIEPALPIQVFMTPIEGAQEGTPKIVHLQDDGSATEVDNVTTPEGEDSLQFEADSFSVYALVYTVDLHYEVDGQVYDLSFEGGTSISFVDVVRALHIVEDDQVEAFVSNIESMEFSTPELVYVGQVEADMTVADFKEEKNLESTYSDELTEEEIAEMEAMPLAAGDWVLVSLQPFETEESLTVTMKDGDQFTVKVTDDQVTMADVTNGGKYLIYYSTGNGPNQTYWVLKNNGDVKRTINRAELDALGDEYLWTFDHFNRFDEDYYLIHNGSTYITLNGTVTDIFSNIATPTYTNESGNPIDGFKMYGREWIPTGFLTGYTVNHYLVFDSNSRVFVLGDENGNSNIKLWEQGSRKYNFTVKTEYSNVYKGTVSGKGWNGAQNNKVASFVSITNENKTNAYEIKAIPSEGYHFKEWRLGKNTLTDFTSETIPAGSLTFTEDYMTLTAVFERNEDYTGVVETDYSAIINAWKEQNIVSDVNLDKTAHVYDYDNRIYEVDLTVDGKATVIAPSLQLAFVTDVSRSMYFPAGLVAARNYDAYSWNPSRSITDVLDSLDNSHYAERHSADGDRVYYLIADPEKSSTIYAVRRDSSGTWRYIDASYDITKYQKKGASGSGWDVYNSSNKRVGWYTLDNTHVKYDNGLKLDGKSLDGMIYVADDVRYRLDYLQQAVDAASELVYTVNPSAEIGLVTFAASANDPVGLYGKNQFGMLLSSLHDISPQGGTNQNDGLNKAKDFWSTASDSDHQRVVILVTDGAPNPGDWNTISNTASQLYTQKGATVHTVGLSVENVAGAEAGLALTAQRGGNGKSYSATNSTQLVNDILDIVKLYLKEANLKGTLHDDIDRVFYPVKEDGTSITPGFYRASDGQAIDTTTVQLYNDKSSAQYGTEYYLWKNNGGQWSITWYNLEFGKGTEANPATHKHFYLKAKEDFMGGNHINTNVDMAHAIGSNAVIRDGSNTTVQPMEVTVDEMAETPFVNVDELHLNEDSTEWTVYLGTDVTPKDQLSELWDNIKVKQVVKEGGTIPATATDPADVTRMNGKEQMWYTHSENNSDADAPANSDADAKLPLSYYGLDAYYDSLLTAITNGTSYDSGGIPYAPYGHDTIGNFKITASKVIDAGANDANAKAPNEHTTDKDGFPVETYKIIVTYTPLTDGASGTYEHTTTGHSAGNVTTGSGADEVKSENTHIINVFKKGLRIFKTNEKNEVLADAHFTLFRTARTSDDDTKVTTLQGVEGDYFPVASVVTTATGIADFDPIERLKNDEVYYLVETKAPPGHNLMNGPLPVILTITDTFIPKPDTADGQQSEQTTRPENTYYNWTETAKLEVQGALHVDENNAVLSGDVTPDSLTTTVYYRINNTAGYELPDTGGSGTRGFRLTGTVMIAGVLLLYGYSQKRRRKGAC